MIQIHINPELLFLCQPTGAAQLAPSAKHTLQPPKHQLELAKLKIASQEDLGPLSQVVHAGCACWVCSSRGGAREQSHCCVL